MQGDHYMKTLKDFFQKRDSFLRLFSSCPYFCSGGEAGFGLSDLPGLPDSCPAVLFYDHCGRFPVAGSIFSFRRDVIKESQQSAEPVCAYGAFVFLFQYDHYK